MSMLEIRQALSTWYSFSVNQVMVGVKMTNDMTTATQWALRIHQTQRPSHQADDIDLLSMALMLQIKMTVISHKSTHDMAFNITAQQEMVIPHLDLPEKQHWIDTVLTSSAGLVISAGPTSTTRQDGGVAVPLVADDLSATCEPEVKDGNGDIAIQTTMLVKASS